MSCETSFSKLSFKQPKKINNFADIKFDSSDFKAKWLKLELEIVNIFDEFPINTTFENLYRVVESFPREVSPEIFQNLKQLCLKHVSQIAPMLFKDDIVDKLFLEHIIILWNNYCYKIEVIKRIFLYFDNKYWSTNPSLMSFENLAIELWQNMFVSAPKFNKALNLCLHKIREQRISESSDVCLVSQMTKMFIKLDLYTQFWEPKYLEEVRNFYIDECQTKIASLSCGEYFSYVDKRLTFENECSKLFLKSDSIRVQLRDQLVEIILRPQLDGLLRNGFCKMMDEKDECFLKLIYNLVTLLSKRSGLDRLIEEFREYVMRVGRVLIDNPHNDNVKDKCMIQGLLNLKKYLDLVVLKCFRDDSMFVKTIRDSFESFINVRPNKPAEYLAKYLNSSLRSGHKGMNEEALDELMDEVMTLFRFIASKDVFEAFYLKDLAKRLLMGKSASVDTEKLMLGRLKSECGSDYTKKMEIMFGDIETSARLNKQYSDYICGHGTLCQTDLCVSVISNGTWPSLGECIPVNLPSTMRQLKDSFTQFYEASHSGKKLRFDSALGTCLLRGYFPLGQKDLQVSEYQCLVLLLFNDLDTGSISYEDVARDTGLDPETLKRTLLSLAAGKGQRVLIKTPQTTEVKDYDTFRFNESFEHKLTRIKFNQIQIKESKVERQITEEQVFMDRKANLDCCIVRLMKLHRKIEHTMLITQVMKELRFPLKAADIKKRIEYLIEKDYMDRDPNHPSTYNYVA